jgi:hypothetical protein
MDKNVYTTHRSCLEHGPEPLGAANPHRGLALIHVNAMILAAHGYQANQLANV